MEQNSDIMIRVDGLKKQYRLGQIGGGTLRGDLQSWWARKRGKEDPNTKIGTDQRLIGQKFMALNGVSFTVKKGEAVGIIGSNGAGKSTLLKLLTHVTAPTEGTIDLYGRVASMLEVGTGFHPEMTGRENVYLNGAILGMTKEEIDAKMDDIIEFSEVRDFIDTPVKRYSSGMYVKLAFSVAAHLDSEIMIMDEVLAVGDMNFQNKCIAKMREIANQGRTILYVSHNMATVRTLCDRCMVLDQGRIIYNGDVEESINRYMQSEGSGGSTRLADIKRHGGATYDLKMLDIHLDSSQISASHPLRFRLHWSCKKAAAQVRLRFIVKYQSDDIVGLTYSTPICDAHPGEDREDAFEFPVNNLAPGKYHVDLLLFNADENGNRVNLDNVQYAFSMTVSPDPEDQTDFLFHDWIHKWMGHVKLPTIQVLHDE